MDEKFKVIIEKFKEDPPEGYKEQVERVIEELGCSKSVARRLVVMNRKHWEDSEV